MYFFMIDPLSLFLIFFLDSHYEFVLNRETDWIMSTCHRFLSNCIDFRMIYLIPNYSFIVQNIFYYLYVDLVNRYYYFFKVNYLLWDICLIIYFKFFFEYLNANWWYLLNTFCDTFVRSIYYIFRIRSFDPS